MVIPDTTMDITLSTTDMAINHMVDINTGIEVTHQDIMEEGIIIIIVPVIWQPQRLLVE